MKSDHSQIELPKGWSAYRKISHAASFFIQISWHSFSLSLFHLRASIRNSLLLVILFDLPFDADYQTPVQSTLRVSLFSTRILGDFAIQLPPRLHTYLYRESLSFGRAAEKARQSLWDFIRDYQRDVVGGVRSE